MLPPFVSYDYQLIPLDTVLGHVFGTMSAADTETVTNALDAGFRWVREFEADGESYAVFEQATYHQAPPSAPPSLPSEPPPGDNPNPQRSD